MDDPSLLPFLNNNGNGHHYSMDIDDEIEHEEDELDDDEDDLQDYEQNAPYPEDEIDEDEIEEDEIDEEEEEENQNEQEILIPPPPLPPIQLQQTIQSERGGRRKGVPRRLQLSPQIIKPPAAQQRLLLSSIPKTMTNVHHLDQPILTSDQEDEPEEDINNENHLDESFHQYSDIKQQNPFQLELLPEHMIANNDYFYDENNNDNSYNDEENIPEIVDELLADIVTTIVRDVRHQRENKFKQQQQRITNGKTNGHLSHKSQTNGWIKSIQKQEQKMTNGKNNTNGFSHSNSIKSSKSHLSKPLSASATSTKLADPSLLFNEFTKMMHLTSQQQLVKQKQSSSSSFTSPPLAKRQKTSDTSSLSQSTTPLSLQQQQQHQQLLWQMTQQLMMSNQPTDPDTSSLLKQQLLGLTPPGTVPKRVGRPPKQQTQPQVMRSSTNMIPPTSHPSTNGSPYERGSFAPRRRGRPPKYVTERGAIPNLSSHDLDASPYDQLFAAIENSVTGNSARTSSTAFHSALASMLGQQAGLSLPPSIIPPAPSAVRNGGTASMVKQSAGQTRHSLPASSTATKLSHGESVNGLDIPLMAAKKRGPGRPPKSQMPLDSHQILQATKRMNSSSLSNNANNNFPPTMVPSSPTSFNLNAAFVEMLQQQLPR